MKTLKWLLIILSIVVIAVLTGSWVLDILAWIFSKISWIFSVLSRLFNFFGWNNGMLSVGGML